MIRYLLVLFVVWPLVELCLVLSLGYKIGILQTILFIVGTGLLGTWLANTQGLTVYRRIQQELSLGRMPTDSLVDGALILLAGVLLIMPGVLTDLIGILLLIPPTRVFFRRWLIFWFQQHFKIHTLMPGPRPDGDNVVDSYATESRESVSTRRLE